MPDTASPFSPDTTTALKARMVHGGANLGTVSDVNLVNGANRALMGQEILQLRDITNNGDSTSTLSYPLCGRRGTDVFVAGHQPGELFVLLDPDDVETIPIGFGTLFEDAEQETCLLSGRDLKPTRRGR